MPVPNIFGIFSFPANHYFVIPHFGYKSPQLGYKLQASLAHL